MTYIVRREFDYDAKHYARGSTWEPCGFRVDQRLIEGRFVTLQDEPPTPKEHKRTESVNGNQPKQLR